MSVESDTVLTRFGLSAVIDQVHHVVCETRVHTDTEADSLQSWLALLPREVTAKLEIARQQALPFMPPDFTPEVIATASEKLPSLTHIDIICVAMHFAMECQDYPLVAALIYTVDRALYRFGRSKPLLRTVLDLRRRSPDTALAPQVTLRSARVMKDEGDLNGALKVIHTIINREDGWQYQDERQYQDTKAACLHVQGQIYHNLELWHYAIPPLVEGFQIFHHVQDWKGIGSCLHVLSRCLCRLQQTQYDVFRRQHPDMFVEEHPCYEGYRQGQGAVDSVQHIEDRFFVAKNQLAADESLLMFAVQIPCPVHLHQILQKIQVEIRTSLSGHRAVHNLQNVESFVEFVRAVHLISLVLFKSPSVTDQKNAHLFEDLSLKLYTVMCFRERGQNQTTCLTHTPHSVDLMNKALKLLRLPKLKDLTDSCHPQSDGTSPEGSLTISSNTVTEQALNADVRGKEKISTNTTTLVNLRHGAENIDLGCEPNILPTSVGRVRGEDSQEQTSSSDCNESGLAESNYSDCNESGLAESSSRDCNESGLAESSSRDCNESGLAESNSSNCNESGLAESTSRDCNESGLAESTSRDCNESGLAESSSNDNVSQTAQSNLDHGLVPAIPRNEAALEETNPNDDVSTNSSECSSDKMGLKQQISCHCGASENTSLTFNETSSLDSSSDGGQKSAHSPGVTTYRAGDRNQESTDQNGEFQNSPSQENSSLELPAENFGNVERKDALIHQEFLPCEEKEWVENPKLATTADKSFTEPTNTPEHVISLAAPTPSQSVSGIPQGGHGHSNLAVGSKARALTFPTTTVTKLGLRQKRARALQKERYVGLAMNREELRAATWPALSSQAQQNLSEEEDTSENEEESLDALTISTNTGSSTSKSCKRSDALPIDFTPHSIKDGLVSTNLLPDKNQPARSLTDSNEKPLAASSPGLERTSAQSGHVCDCCSKTGSKQLTVDQYCTTKSSTPEISSVSSSDPDSKRHGEVAHLSEGDSLMSCLHLGLDHQAQAEDVFSEQPSEDVPVHKSSDCVAEAILFTFNAWTGQWSRQSTLIHKGDNLPLAEDNPKGAFRDAFFVQFLHQNEPLARYVGKKYRKRQKPSHVYMRDVTQQMNASYYVTLFNEALNRCQTEFLRIHFLPACHMQILNEQGEVNDWLNVEPFMNGRYHKITNNATHLTSRHDLAKGVQVATAFSHFSYVWSGGRCMVVDLQGCVPNDKEGVIYLTDPVLHTRDKADASTFDRHEKGMEDFWNHVHTECNEFCRLLELDRHRPGVGGCE